ncbi:HipA domain-containing protein [Cryobacterium sp. PH31-L1]|uniref:type II toxin-antitoxin system HipA family toxin n=1 Tax=Cryobacterium sp. PH31-L1 TaxID=3046199 RepID=UPI0024BAC2AC|nr:HipA domain-containing protein [Cryobacterium sp. PH31-L1]MDJ0376444.1 HipA domain-containing protein [Cryobacterium sp. PH31-L1]
MTDAEVWVQLNGSDVRAGTVYSHRRRGSESATFAYTPEYLAKPGAYSLDPALPMSSGAFNTTDGHSLFGAFTDCAPDRWGRRLLERSERRRASRNGVTERSFGELDFTLGVRDDLRQGAIRFRMPDAAAWQAEEAGSVPHLVDLSRLLRAVESVESENPDDEALRLLLGAGSSIGGARPKAAVVNGRGELLIAKFPRVGSDEWDVMAWEHLSLTLASRAGINTPRHELMNVAGRNVLLLNRFDRQESHRIGYASAMTMLEAVDGERRSYLEIAEVIEQSSSSATSELNELWRRIAFSILISNTDDHLRNHGFLRSDSEGSWNLSPAFDLNPNPTPGTKHLSTAIDFDTYTANTDMLLDVAPYFRVRNPRVVLAQIADAVSGWAAEARLLGIAESEIDLMSGAFAAGER